MLPTLPQTTSMPTSSRGLLGADARPAPPVPALAGRASENHEQPRRGVEDIFRCEPDYAGPGALTQLSLPIIWRYNTGSDFAEPGEMEARMLAEDDHTGVGPGLILGTIVLIGSLGLLLCGVLTIIAFNLAERI